MTAPSSPTLRSATAICRGPRGARCRDTEPGCCTASQERHQSLRPLLGCSCAVPSAKSPRRSAGSSGARAVAGHASRGRAGAPMSRFGVFVAAGAAPGVAVGGRQGLRTGTRVGGGRNRFRAEKNLLTRPVPWAFPVLRVARGSPRLGAGGVRMCVLGIRGARPLPHPTQGSDCWST